MSKWVDEEKKEGGPLGGMGMGMGMGQKLEVRRGRTTWEVRRLEEWERCEGWVSQGSGGRGGERWKKIGDGLDWEVICLTWVSWM